MRKIETWLASLMMALLFGNCNYSSELLIVAPIDGQIMANNMPIMSWEADDCDYFEIWIDGIKMDSVSGSVSSYVPFPLSFGNHQWKVVSVKGNERTESVSSLFSIDDEPLVEMPANAQLLRTDWRMQSSLELPSLDGKILSSESTETSDWYGTSLPTTVLSALVRNGVYPNPYIEKNNMLIPDINDAYNEKYDLIKYSHISGKNPWQDPYWFYKEFELEKEHVSGQIWLNFSEINYRAEVWLNGHLLADTIKMVGMERSFRFDVTSVLNMTGKNQLAVAIYPPDYPGEPSLEPLTPLADPGTNMADGMIGKNYTKWDVLGWDWQPVIRDRDMGITEDVFLSFTNDVELVDLYATSRLPLPDTTSADLTISANLINHSNQSKNGIVKVMISHENETINFTDQFTVEANGSCELLWDKDKIAQLHIENPKLWWPLGYGKQNLYEVKLSVSIGETVVSEIATNMGVRNFETFMSTQSRGFKVNGREIYLKGGNWVIDMMLNWNAQRYEEEILLTRNANLNVLRIWGPTGVPPKAFYDAADKYGILIWQDFLNDFWGTFRNTPGYQPEISLFEKASIDIVKKYRNHPSLFLWCGGNEGVNPREEILVDRVLAKYDNRETRHYLTRSDGDGLHGGGPYHTIRPKAYFKHPKLKGFSSEIGPSGLPVYESIIRFMPNIGKSWKENYFPIDGTWAYHDANDWPGHDSRKFSSYDSIVRYDYAGPLTEDEMGVKTYLKKAQLVNYDVYRASIESINRQIWNGATGILLWKSNSSWPSMVWQVYDWYMQAHAGSYATKKASEPVHIQLNRDDNSIVALNTTYRILSNAKLSATLYDKDLNILWSKEMQANLDTNKVTSTDWIVPETTELSFLKLTIDDGEGNRLSDNFYWLQKSNDFSGIDALPKAKLATKIEARTSEGIGVYEVTVTNKGKGLAYMVLLKMIGDRSKNELLPSYWSENYLNLLPNESKTVKVVISPDALHEKPLLVVEAYN